LILLGRPRIVSARYLHIDDELDGFARRFNASHTFLNADLADQADLGGSELILLRAVSCDSWDSWFRFG